MELGSGDEREGDEGEGDEEEGEDEDGEEEIKVIGGVGRSGKTAIPMMLTS